MACKFGPKPVKSKAKGKQRETEVSVAAPLPSLRLLDASDAEMELDAESREVWASAKTMVFSDLPSLHGDQLRLPVHWRPPQVLALQLSADVPVVGVPLLAQATLQNCSLEQCRWVWQRLDDSPGAKDRWEDVGTDALYVPIPADRGRSLRVCCSPPRPGRAVWSPATKELVEMHPEDAWRWEALSVQREAPTFRIVSYNVLADAYAGRKWHMENLWYYCAPGVVAAPRRRQLVLRDFLAIDADILGMQEADSGQLSALAPLGALGWEHHFTKKTGQACDGCALFWRRSRFEAQSAPVEMRLCGKVDDLPGLAQDTARAISQHRNTRDVLANVNTVAQCVLLRDLAAGGRLLLVANTHLFYSPHANHIRLLQLHMLLSELDTIRKCVEEKEGQLVAVVLLGDLNARKGSFGPTDKGRPPQAAYRLIRDGRIHADDVDWEQSVWCPDEWKEGRGSANENDDAGSVCICCQDRGEVEGYGVCPLCEGVGMNHLRMELHLPL